ncbi:hypothetical protein CBOM_08020 [Ceraceosorus bombacis]|uniref:Uncharacterized protein n=1 Tax=Ceraceosorus bombacis TaxID=401625 RepID=A0A0P1B9W0_9BASI|nr:hypothetical protein CBOM_08020 [Ceraceosorus bombacis]
MIALLTSSHSPLTSLAGFTGSASHRLTEHTFAADLRESSRDSDNLLLPTGRHIIAHRLSSWRRCFTLVAVGEAQPRI